MNRKALAALALAMLLVTSGCTDSGVHAKVCADSKTHERLNESACEQDLSGTQWRYYDGETLIPRIGKKLPWGLSGSSEDPGTEVTYIPSTGGTAKKVAS